MKKKKLVILSIVILLLAVLAWWVFRTPDHLADLKKMEPAAVDPQAELLIMQFFDGVRKKDTRSLMKLMLIRDSTDFERYTDPFLKGESPDPVEIIGCRRLVKSSKDHLIIQVFCKGQGRAFSFTCVKNKQGEFRIYSVGLSSKKK